MVKNIDKKERNFLKEVLSQIDIKRYLLHYLSPKDIEGNVLDQIKKKRRVPTHVICIPISKGLSGTMNVLRQIT